MVRVLSADNVASVLDIDALLPVVAEAFEKQHAGAVERPDRPHYPFGTGLDPDAPAEPTGTGLCMPAYVHGADYVATKLVAVCKDNVARGLPTVTAQLALTDAETGQPVGYLAGNRITNARTGCIGGVAARELAVDDPIDLAVIGAGKQARWQTRAIAAATDALESIRIYAPSDSRVDCAAELEAELDVPAHPVSSPRDAVADATVVVTATTSSEPVFPGDELAPGTLVIAVGAYTPEMRELDDETVERAARIFGDVPEEAAETGDLRGHVDREVEPVGAVIAGDRGREADEEILVVESVGSAVLDAASAEAIFDRAVSRDVGTKVAL
ncbi:ornithine cyclodeaminase family protein [Natrialba aegyptia]|uniref:Ornithine cyclodeaminase/mu-crystallin n=1 Tax=Natrialba aegyptia DSM 13077 TaxID=1227491 RepID=M0BIH6_9EURY|nr:ornithine cyclodeaminase family protein [Natrialba aegyptia]ELZ10277.1 ornithine cyclodeaminase/mu-crystallin [Natrialba aegyptia DSM 13077]